MSEPDKLKVAICEYLLSVNEAMDPPRYGPAFIPMTAIDWIAYGIVAAIEPFFVSMRAERDEAREAARFTYHTDDHNEAARRWPWIEQEEGVTGAT